MNKPLGVDLVRFEVNMKQESNSDLEALRMEIADFHKALIGAHWQKDVDFFVQDLSED